MAARERGRALSGIARGGIAVTAIAVAVQSLLDFAYIVVFDRHHQAINADAEASVAAWLGSVGEFACALLVALLAFRFPARARTLGVLACVLAFFSLDDIVSIHEWLGRLGTDALGVSSDHSGLIWPFLYLPLLTIVALGFVRIGLESGDEVLMLLLGGLGLLATGIALELLSPVIQAVGLDRVVPEVVIEEGAELMGWGLVATGLLVAVVAQFSASAPAAPPPLRR